MFKSALFGALIYYEPTTRAASNKTNSKKNKVNPERSPQEKKSNVPRRNPQAMAAYPVPEEGIAEAVAYVAERGYGRVTLQFPDDMLHFAPAVAERLQSELSACSSNAKVRWSAARSTVDDARIHISGGGRSKERAGFESLSLPERALWTAPLRPLRPLHRRYTAAAAHPAYAQSLAPYPPHTPHSTPIHSTQQVYVLADTTYNPLSVDEVAAQHVNADCVVRAWGRGGGGRLID